MTQTSSPWDGINTGDAVDAPYSSAEWARLWTKLHGVGSVFPNYGPLLGTGDGTYPPLQVRAVGGAVVEIKIGSALVNGRLYETSAAEQLTVGANVSGNPRIDTVILRVDYTAQTTRLVIKQGTPAASPVRPSLTQTASTWEAPLADIAVANGFSSITQADITDRSRFVQSSAAGWQPYAYPLNYIPYNGYSSAYAWIANLAFAIPFVVAGNMLVEQMAIIGRGNSSPNVTWGIYTEDRNDADVATGILRRLGGRDTAATTAVANAARATFPAIPAPVVVPPGAHWLLVLVKSATLSLGVVTPAASSFESGMNMMRGQTGVINLAQTEDLTTGWSASADTERSFSIRLEGRINGQTTAF